MGGEFAKENGFPVYEIKQCEDEFNYWGLRKYLYL
jgi:hypothetical protein